MNDCASHVGLCVCTRPDDHPGDHYCQHCGRLWPEGAVLVVLSPKPDNRLVLVPA